MFLSGCEARAFNLGNKNMKIGIFTGGTSVRLKNIFTGISRYPTGKYEIKGGIKGGMLLCICWPVLPAPCLDDTQLGHRIYEI